MPRGGKREGAGRKKGSIGAVRKAQIEAAHKVREAVLAGKDETPLEYMLRVMRDKDADEKRRDAMAIAAAAFVHPRLAATSVSLEDKRSLDEFDTHELVASLHAEGDPSGAFASEAGDRAPDQVH